jgi:pimeloyl-ACP methyl ester carboxylesterase
MSPPDGRAKVLAVQTTVTVGRDKLWAEDSEGAGPVVVLLHPGIADARVWDPVWPELARSCRVIRYDVRGYAKSPPATENYTLVADLRAVLDQRGVTGAHLVGTSMGGATAIDFALAEPDRVESLVLLCPGVSGYPWPDEPELEAEEARLTAAGDEDGLLRLSLRQWAAAGDDPVVADLMRTAMRAWPNEEEFQQEGPTAYDRLEEVRVPAVLLLGDRDWPALIACDEELARRIPGCRLVRAPGVDHLPSLRAPELVTATILDSVANAGPDVPGAPTEPAG